MNIVVVGLGSMGRRRIRLLRGKYPEYELLGIDYSAERRKEVSAEYGISTYEKIEMIEMDKHEKIFCVFVCTAPLTHAQIIKVCLQKKWHVFSEINLVSDEYDENIQLAKEKNKVLFLSSTPLYRSEMKEIKKQVIANSKQVNYIYHVGQYLPDWHPWESYKDFFVGEVRTNGCREILAIELPWIVDCFGEVNDVHVIKGKMSDLQVAYSDSIHIQLVHSSGSIGTIVVDLVSRVAVRYLEIFNDELYIRWDGKPSGLEVFDVKHKKTNYPLKDAEYRYEKGYATFANEYAYLEEINQFLEVIKDNKESIYTFEKDRKILDLIDTIEGEEP